MSDSQLLMVDSNANANANGTTHIINGIPQNNSDSSSAPATPIPGSTSSLARSLSHPNGTTGSIGGSHVRRITVDMPEIVRALAEIEIHEERRRALSHASDHSSQSPIFEGIGEGEGILALHKSMANTIDHTDESLREIKELVTRITDGGTSITSELKTLTIAHSMVQSELKEMKSMMASIQTGGTKVYEELKQNNKTVDALFSCSEKVLTTLTKRVDRDEERRHHREQRRLLRLEERARIREEQARRELAHQEEEAKLRESQRQERHERKAFAAQLAAHTTANASQHAESQSETRKQMWIVSSAVATSAFILGWFVRATAAPTPNGNK